MSKINKDNLSHLGLDYQKKLVNQLLVDSRFAESILDIIVPHNFDDPTLNIFVSVMKDAYDKSESVLDISGLTTRLLATVNDEITKQKFLANIKELTETQVTDTEYVHTVAMQFFKRQNLKTALKKIDVILQKGELDEYYECEDIIKTALEAGDNKDESVDILDNMDDVLAPDYRKPIPTGIEGLDKIMDGGLSKGELGIILAALGVGKTTLITKIANHAKNSGYNVLQIFFEDLPKQVQRKHYACWTGISISELGDVDKVDYVKSVVTEKGNAGGVLKLRKMSGADTTIPKIKKYIKTLIGKGFRPDLVLIDYIDVVQPSKRYDDNNVAEGSVMREFEAMLDEFNIAGWTAIQGNRSSINTEFVETDQMGGSIKKAQIGHFIMSVAKSLEQRDNNTANIAILKSRFGDDGLTFEDCEFNNGTVSISLANNNGPKTFLQKKESNLDAKNDKLKAALNAHRKNNKLE